MKKISIITFLIFILFSCTNNIGNNSTKFPIISENKITWEKFIKWNLEKLYWLDCSSFFCSYRWKDIKKCNIEEFSFNFNNKKIFLTSGYDYICKKDWKVLYRFYLNNWKDSIFKNKKLLFKYNSAYIEKNRIKNVLEIDNSLVFETYRKKNWKVLKDIYFKDWFLTKKFNLNSAFNIFKYNWKYWFIWEKNWNYNIYWL